MPQERSVPEWSDSPSCCTSVIVFRKQSSNPDVWFNADIEKFVCFSLWKKTPTLILQNNTQVQQRYISEKQLHHRSELTFTYSPPRYGWGHGSEAQENLMAVLLSSFIDTHTQTHTPGLCVVEPPLSLGPAVQLVPLLTHAVSSSAEEQKPWNRKVDIFKCVCVCV